MTLRIAMWSGPRNISTAMMRSWENRSDTVVWDEPLYAHYLVATGCDHPGRAETLEAHDADADAVASALSGPVPGDASIWYQKHMAHHLLPGMDRGWMDHVEHCFLVREPTSMLASLHSKTPFPTLEDTGLPQQVGLFREVMSRRGEAPPVLDARDVLENPRDILKMLCKRLGLQFQEAMLSWPAGRRESDGAWAPYWYEAVEASTGFSSTFGEPVEFPVELEEMLEDCRACYEELHQHRLGG